jgi:hypothetical protein
MKKALVLAMIVGLMVGSSVTADAKKRRKPRPVTMKYFLHFPAQGDTCGTRYMDLKDSVDSGCGYTFQPANEVLTQAGQGLIAEWPATGGFPFKLNAKKPIKAEFQLMNVFGLPANGHAIFDFELSGTVGGQPVTLFEQSKEMTMAAPGSNVATFTAKVSKKLNGKPVTGLHATTNVHGASSFHYFELDANGAYISVAGLK